MKTTIRKCKDCSLYTLQVNCPKCGKETVMALPPRFSPRDRFMKYRMNSEMEKNGENSDKTV